MIHRYHGIASTCTLRQDCCAVHSLSVLLILTTLTQPVRTCWSCHLWHLRTISVPHIRLEFLKLQQQVQNSVRLSVSVDCKQLYFIDCRVLKHILFTTFSIKILSQKLVLRRPEKNKSETHYRSESLLSFYYIQYIPQESI